MTPQKIIGQVILAISGGTPTSDIAVKEWDIRSYIPAAVNFALTSSYRASMQEEGDTGLPTNFLSEHEDLAVLSDSKDRDYIDVPSKIVSLPSNRGIRYVMDDCGNRYKPVPEGAGMGCYWGKVLGAIPYYELRGKKIYLINKPPLVESVNVGTVTNVDDVGDDEELPIPAGYEPQVVDIIVALFKDQRFSPRDYIIDGRDLRSTE